ncbi:hypothetical protein HDU83_006379 [Entophlyctis luteolus]|nr:hypothetical protein HDU83_006379 [Entophlyctis luteolus]
MNQGKAVVRTIKNYTKGYSDMQIKVRRDFIEIMEMIDKRLNDNGKNWRHVYKALVLLDFLLIAGSENVIKYAKENLYVIKTLKEFIFLDDDGRDHGVNVRQLSKDITAHLLDEARLREERSGNRHNYRYSGSDDERDHNRQTNQRSYRDDEDDELRRALEESKRTAEAEERKRAGKPKNDSDLKKALEMDRFAIVPQFKNKLLRSRPPPPKEEVLVDFFAPVQAAQPNLFDTSANPFGGFGSGYQDAFALQQQQQQQALEQERQRQLALQQQQQLAMEQERMRQLALQQQQQLALQQQQQQAALLSGFSAYDAQAASRQVAADPLFDVARNSSNIDPFANLAASRSSVGPIGLSAVRSSSHTGASNPFGNTSNTNSNFGTNDSFKSMQPNQVPLPTSNNVFNTSNSAAFTSAPSSTPKNPFGVSTPSSTSSPFATSIKPSTASAFSDLSPFGAKTSNIPIGQLAQQQQLSSVTASPFGTMGSSGSGGQGTNLFATQSYGQQQQFGTNFGAQETPAGQPFGMNAAQPFGTSSQAFGGYASSAQQPALNPLFGSQAQPMGNQQPFGQQPQQPFGTQQYNGFGQSQSTQQSFF